MTSAKITTLFLDIGGVLLTNGWDRTSRNKAVQQFKLDADELNERHHLTFDTYEQGKLSLKQYLDRVVFYEPRHFTLNEFKDFMFSQSKPYPEIINYIHDLKTKHKLRVTAVSNEGRELTDYRIKTFKLYEIFDAFVASSFVHFRKPDEDIYKIALDISQVNPEEVVYLDDRKMFIEVANSLKINGVHHNDFESTKDKLAGFGLTL